MIDDVMAGSLTTHDSTSTPASSGSPVTWHVIIWILITLGINSMAQPSNKMLGRFNRQRMYICSSPILGLADALMTALHIIIAKFYLDITFREASKIVTMVTSEFGPSEKEKQPKPEDMQTQSRSWPHFLFFVFGPLPAIIKLMAFSGTPWTKIWGIMFTVSFIIMEIVNFLARGHIEGDELSVPGILGYTSMEWQEPPQQARRIKSTRLAANIGFILVFPLMTAYISNATLMVYATQPLWRAAWDSAPLKNILPYIASITIWVFPVILIIWIVMLCLGCIPVGQKQIMRSIAKWSLVMSAASLPPKKFHFPALVSPIFPPFPSWGDGIMPILYLAYLVYSPFYWGMSHVCRRWPGVGRSLIIDRNQERRELDSPSESPVAQVATEPLDEYGCDYLGFFLSNLLVYILWYAYIYDPAGTINPSWTQIFG